jgi:hypothetical protein
LRLFRRRHLGGIDTKAHFAPFLCQQRIGEISAKVIETELPLLAVLVMTTHSVVLKEGNGCLVESVPLMRPGLSWQETARQ